jgi:drug/metabolite transporter (DMT)-like permease
MTADGPGQGRAARPGRPLPLAVCGACVISSSAVLVTLAGVGAATTTVARCGLALPVLGVLAWREARRRGRRPRRARLASAGAGLLLGIDLVLWNHAIVEVGAGVATVLANLQVLFVAGAAWALLGERPRRAYLAALPVVLAGVVLVSGLADGGRAGRHALAGIIYGLTASVAYSGFLFIFRQSSRPATTVLSSTGPSSMGPSTTGEPRSSPALAGAGWIAGPLADATAGAGVAGLAAGLAFGGLSARIPWPSLGWLALLALSSQVTGWLLITSSLPRLPAAVSSLLLLIQPAGSLLLAALILGQRPAPLQLIGAAAVCGGILAATGTIPGSRRAAPGPVPP